MAAAVKPRAAKGHSRVILWVVVAVTLAGVAFWLYQRNQAAAQAANAVTDSSGVGADLGYLDSLSADQLVGADQGGVAGAGVPVASSPLQPVAGGTPVPSGSGPVANPGGGSYRPPGTPGGVNVPVPAPTR